MNIFQQPKIIDFSGLEKINLSGRLAECSKALSLPREGTQPRGSFQRDATNTLGTITTNGSKDISQKNPGLGARLVQPGDANPMLARLQRCPRS
eukprot:scaffold27713_cov43-Prasinocladus_malaysianus.AAC.1